MGDKKTPESLRDQAQDLLEAMTDEQADEITSYLLLILRTPYKR